MSEAAEAVLETAAEIADDSTAPVTEATEAPEDRALTMGWVPRDQFRGDPERWVDAATFIKKGEEFLPFLKANNKRLEQALERQSKETASLRRTLDRFADHHTKTEARAYERALKDLEARQTEAASVGDVEAVRGITAEIVDLTKEAGAPKGGNPAEQGKTEAFDAFVEENPWFNTDPAMRGAAIALADELVASGVLDPKKQLAEVAKRIKAEFPHKFENPARKAPAAVEGNGAAVRKTGKTWADLPADAKQMADEFVRDIKGFTREKYVKDYFGSAT